MFLPFSHCLVAEMWGVAAVLAVKLKAHIMDGKLHPWHAYLTCLCARSLLTSFSTVILGARKKAPLQARAVQRGFYRAHEGWGSVYSPSCVDGVGAELWHTCGRCFVVLLFPSSLL